MSDAYSAALESGSTRLCRCFLMTRADGMVLGFTDHDEDVTFEGVTFRASGALTSSEAASQLGLSPDEMDASGALSDEFITEADLSAGVYDGARVEVFDVDWTSPAIRRRLARYSVGQVERGALAFRAELRSLAASLDISQGRVHTTLCDCRRLGDARCKLDLTGLQGVATVVSVSGYDVTVSGLDGFASSFFARGTVEWLAGANAGWGADIRASRRMGALTLLSLWREPARAVATGDTLRATAGCDRTAEACRNRFANFANFRGFPHMPGETFISEYAVSGDANQTGGSRFA